MKKMLMLATTAAMSEQFNKNNILILEEMGYEVHVAGNWKEGNPISDERLEQFKEWLAEHHGKWFHISATRKPHDIKNNYSAYKEVVRLIKEYNYEFIHCHTPIGSVIGRGAAHFTKTKIIYTAHGFHFYKGAPLKNWLIYYPIEKFLSKWTDILVLINKEDYERASKKFHAAETIYVPGIGIDIEKIENVECDKNKVRESLGVKEDEIMLLSVGELIPRKNHAFVIDALYQLNNPKIKYFICGKGVLKEQLNEQICQLGLEKNIILLGYRNDVVQLCKSADLFIFPSLQEGLPVALMEAIASKVTVIGSNIRGNRELIKNRDALFKFTNTEEVIKCISLYKRDRDIFSNYSELQKFSIHNVIGHMKRIYKEIGG